MSYPETSPNAEHGLLIDATQKLIELRQNPAWRSELPSRCPPVLWFGNAHSSKPRILTLGANPSRQEYLADHSSAALHKMATSSDGSTLSYLERSDSRFRVLSGSEKLEDILTNISLQADILKGYNRYFSANPYLWFGKRQSPYNVEAFLRGMGTSYYENQPQSMQAIHIDLFPFATLSDFKSIQRLAEDDLFRNKWAQSMIARLVELLKPEAILVFGKTNFEYFARYLDPSVGRFGAYYFEKATFWHGTSNQIRLIGLSTNLGNPIGFNKERLAQFGSHVARASGLGSPSAPDTASSPAPVRTYTSAPPKTPKPPQKPSASWKRLFGSK